MYPSRFTCIITTEFYMATNHVNAVAFNSTAALVKPTKETKFKKPPNMRKIRLQHPQQGKDFTVDFVNDDGKAVCSLCKNTFEKMESLYGHMMEDHSDGDWKTFFTVPKTPTVIKVADSMLTPVLRWKLTQKRGCHPSSCKLPSMRKRVGLKTVDHDQGLEAENTHLELEVTLGRSSITQTSEILRQIPVDQESKGRREVVFNFDLNQTPPMDMQEEDEQFSEKIVW
ncbi:unnamed protein product [Lactuca saligna]|uniref:C2H2-type domain-containing protein n=1 Tax=Lactuca saligna TaxID=75948 RepID=A0AA35ZSX5_LACSI|nr:unnamed protein product [Lactuca saligna]